MQRGRTYVPRRDLASVAHEKLNPTAGTRLHSRTNALPRPDLLRAFGCTRPRSEWSGTVCGLNPEAGDRALREHPQVRQEHLTERG